MKGRGVKGFTLIELLVTVAIIGALASLLLPALQKGKESGRATVCRNNLRQVGLALGMYGTDHGAFPSESFWISTNPVVWQVSLRPYLEAPAEAEVTRGVWVCPSYVQAGGRVAGSRMYTGSYGYNIYGGGGSIGEEAMGLGGFFRKTASGAALTTVVPTKESDLVEPSNLFAIGDSVIFRVKFLGSPSDESPWLWGRTGIDFGLDYRGGLLPSGDGYEDGMIALETIRRRHGGKFNMALADAHVETLRVEEVFSATERVMKRWNVDHLPHMETERAGAGL